MKYKSNFAHFGWCTGAFLALFLGACTSPEIKPEKISAPVAVQKNSLLTGYACCNLHYEGDVFNDTNRAQLAFIPAGTPIKVNKIEANRADVEVAGKAMRFEHDQGRADESTEQWLSKLVVPNDPRLKFANFPPLVRKAIEAGKLMKGMTKEQVIISVGYPQINQNMRLDGPTWRYWWSSYGPFYVYWSGNTVKKIDGHSETVSHMTYKK